MVFVTTQPVVKQENQLYNRNDYFSCGILVCKSVFVCRSGIEETNKYPDGVELLQGRWWNSNLRHFDSLFDYHRFRHSSIKECRQNIKTELRQSFPS